MMARTISGVLCAIALMRCGGDGSGGTNGPTGDDGDPPGTGDGGTPGGNGYVPNPSNPLIAAIPGLWEVVELNGQPVDNSRCDCTDADCTTTESCLMMGTCRNYCEDATSGIVCTSAGCVTVDPSNPSCHYEAVAETCDENGYNCYPGSPAGDLGPPGDACVRPFGSVAMVILEGDVLRRDPRSGCPQPDCIPGINCACFRTRGRILDNGTRMEYTRERWDLPDRSDLSSDTRKYRKVR